MKEKEPFYATVYKHNFLQNKKSVRINKYTLGIELEVCYLIKKNFFNLKKNITKRNITRYITHMAPCIEVVGYRQRKKGIKFLGDLCSDFGGNVKFVIGANEALPYVVSTLTSCSNIPNSFIFGNTLFTSQP